MFACLQAINFSSDCMFDVSLSCSVITAINYILNMSANNVLDLESAVSYIVSIIENNKDTFAELFSMTDVRSGRA